MAREMARERMSKRRALPHRFGENYLGGKRAIVKAERKRGGKVELLCDIGGRERWIKAHRLRTMPRKVKRSTKGRKAPKRIDNPNVNDPNIMRAVARLLRGA